MGDLDAIRFMASEHDLEFVDLDTYGVDPAARDILPGDLARSLGVVAIKRKFGTPVIATSDPDDVAAQESVREAIGRDFISVVATAEQIARYLDGDASPVTTDDPVEPGGRQFADVLQPAPAFDVADVDRFMAELTAADQGSGHGPEGPGPALTVDALERITPETVRYATDPPATGVPASARSDEPAGPSTGDPFAGIGPEAPGDGGAVAEATPAKERKGKKSGKHAAPVDGSEVVDPVGAALPSEPGPPVSDDGGAAGSGATMLDRLHEVSAILATDGAERPPSGSPAVPGLPALEGFPAAPGGSPPAGAPPLPVDAPVPPHPDGTRTAADPPPAGGLAALAGFEFGTTTDGLAALAESLQDDEWAPPSDPDQATSEDSTTAAADLVAEAVATYQERRGDDGAHDWSVGDASPTANFPHLAKVLVDGGRVSLEDMTDVLAEQAESGLSIAHILTNRKLVTEADLMWGMAEEMGLEFVDLDVVGVNLAEAGAIPEATARHHNVMVIGSDNGTPIVAASNPTDVFAMDDLRTIMGRNFIVVVATRSQILAHIGRAFNTGGDAGDVAMEASLEFDTSSDTDTADIQTAVTEEAPIVRYVNLLILQALNERASDIHVEPTATELRIRYRIDGVLHDVSTAPRKIAPAVTTRLKVMADMNIAEHRVPQDGRISLNVGARAIDLRMATMPTIHGEKVVMRVLDKSNVVLEFSDLGFDDDLMATYEGLYTKPYGTILVTGPTGSGKSTTLYTTLAALNSPEKNIITVEDPVESPLKGANQVQVNNKAGLTFAAALKAILRSDPDIVLVGEIRDKETASIAIEAAMTGHMVLSTLHTNSAAATPMRLIEMGLEPFLVTSSLSGVLAQRLARRLCVHCKEPYEPTEADMLAAGWTPPEVEAVGGMSVAHRAVGCSACANTGYRGRKALVELMPMSEEIERLIIEGGSVDDIHRLAVQQGMVTLRQSGLRKAIEGETTLEEVLRVVA